MSKVKQTYQNLEKALGSLEESLATPPVENRDFAGIVKNFEFTYELFWKTLKVILETNGVSAPFPRVALEEGYKRGMLEGNEIWKDIMDARNETVHTYDQKFAQSLVKDIQDKYLIVFQRSLVKLKTFVNQG